MTLIQLSIPNEARLLHSSLHSFYKYSSWLPTPLAASEVLGVVKTPRFSGCGAESIYSRRTCIPPPPRLGIFPQCYHSGGIRPRASTMSVESRIINAEGCGVCPKKNKKKKKKKKRVYMYAVMDLRVYPSRQSAMAFQCTISSFCQNASCNPHKSLPVSGFRCFFQNLVHDSV